MRIVIVSDWFAEKMGYSENVLPKALAKLGAEVHVVTSDLQPAFPNYAETYEAFIGPRIQPVGVSQLNGFTLHRLPHGSQYQGVYIHGLHNKLVELKPDIVQCFTIPSLCTYQTALSKLLLGFEFFLEEHVHASVFTYPRTWKRHLYYTIYKRTVGPFLGLISERCYPIAPDVAEIVTQYFGYPAKKLQLCSLGTDTDLFFPPQTEEDHIQRFTLRRELGFSDEDIVAIYTGRFSIGKNPQCLAKAIDALQDENPHFKGLFVGAGTSEEIQAIQNCRGCVVHPFVHSVELPRFYRAADIGVWPKQESTSQLDALACGLPIIISDRVQARERVEGNGFVYREDDVTDLARQLKTLTDPALRKRLGDAGMAKAKTEFSWNRIASDRLQAYASSLKRA